MNPIVLSIPIFFLLIGIEWAWSWYKKKQVYRLGDAFANIGCGVVEQLTGLFVKVFTIALYSYVYHEFRLFTLPTTWPWLILLFIGIDFAYYWAHRMSHEVNLFWIGHVVHHQSEDYNLSVALRQGALQKVFTSPFFLPLAVLGFSDEWFLFLSAFNTLYQFWIHTEWIDKLPAWFEWLFNTPSHHRVHHGRNAQYIDKNHGGTLIIWDRLFGTFALEEEKVQYGVTLPVRSWNPLWAHWLPVRDLFLQVKAASGEFHHALFRSPTWIAHNRPQWFKALHYTGDFGFDTRYPKSLVAYALVHFTWLIAQSAVLLFTVDAYSFGVQLLMVLLILAQFVWLGHLLEGQKVFSLSEWLRAALAAFAGIWLFQAPMWMGFVLFAAMIGWAMGLKNVQAVNAIRAQ